MLAAYRRTRGKSRLAWSEGRQPLGAVLHVNRIKARRDSVMMHETGKLDKNREILKLAMNDETTRQSPATYL